MQRLQHIFYSTEKSIYFFDFIKILFILFDVTALLDSCQYFFYNILGKHMGGFKVE